jgi:hypothetical protein
MSQDSKKCIAVHLPIDLFEKINEFKAKSALSQSGIIIDLLEKGLGKIQNTNTEVKKYFFVKVRIDPAKMIEFGRKLQNGEIDTSLIIMTYCIKDDPTVGFSFWKAENQRNFEEVFSQHTPYYKEILEIIPVISPTESMKVILENMNTEK